MAVLGGELQLSLGIGHILIPCLYGGAGRGSVCGARAANESIGRGGGDGVSRIAGIGWACVEVEVEERRW